MKSMLNVLIVFFSLYLSLVNAESVSIRGGSSEKINFTTANNASITANAINPWLFNDAKVDNESWLSPGEVKGKNVAATRYMPQTPSVFSVIMDGHLIPPAGGGQGRVDFTIKAYLEGEFSIEPKKLFTYPVDKVKSDPNDVFIARLSGNMDGVNANWSASPTWGGYQGFSNTNIATVWHSTFSQWKPPVGRYTVSAYLSSDTTKNAQAVMYIADFKLEKKETGQTGFTALQEGGTAYISGGTETEAPLFPIIQAKYTGKFAIDYSLQYGVSKTVQGVVRNITGYELREQLSTTEGAEVTKTILKSEAATNGGILRTHQNRQMGFLVKYKLEGSDEEKIIKANIKGRNPTSASVKNFINARNLAFNYNNNDIDLKAMYQKIIYHESMHKQFNSSGTYAGEPNYGYPYGWGVAQVDKGNISGLQSHTALMWNWHENLNEGISIFRGKHAIVNEIIGKIGLHRPNLPPLSDDQFIHSMVIAYNGFGGTHLVPYDYDNNGQPIHVLFCYNVTAAGDQWGTFKDNSNTYWALVSNTIVP